MRPPLPGSHNPLTRGSRFLWLALGAIPVLVFVWNSLFFTPWMVDDAFISLRYAHNLIAGHGLVYNPGERIEGFSNFSWVALAAALMALQVPLLTTLKAIGLIAGVATLVLASALARHLAGPSDGRICGTVALWYLGCNTSLALWCQSALETALYAALIVSMCLRYEMEVESERRRPWSAALFALAWMTRPETPVYGLYFLVRRATLPRRPDRRDGWWLATFAAFLVPYEIWGYAYYGAWLPQTGAAKIGAWDWRNLAGLRSLLFDQGWGFSALLALALAGAVLRRRLPPAAWLPVVSGLSFAIYAGPDWMPGYRLFVPILPIQACLVALGIRDLLGSGRRGRLRFALMAGLTLLAGADYARAQLGGAVPLGPGKPFALANRSGTWWREVPRNLRERDWPLEMMALSILGHSGPDDRIAAKDFGFPGFLTMNRVWDLAGLVTPVSADLRHHGEASEVGERFVREFLHTGAATHIFIPELRWPNVVRLEGFLATHPDLQGRYRILEPEPGGPPPRRFDRIVLGIPPGASRVWRLQELPSPTPGEVLANLERRLQDVVARFPEYGPRAAEVVTRFRRYVEGASGGVEDGVVTESD